MSRWQHSESPHAARWISREFSELLRELNPPKEELPPASQIFDLLIVGSGYGGAVAAATLAGCTDGNGKAMRVGLLERGLEFLPGAFPARMVDLPRQVRGSFGGRPRGGEALFDLRIGEDASVLVANGLGGGSLINAGVMERPGPDVFRGPRWPAALRTPAALDAYYARARQLLGAEVPPVTAPESPREYDRAPLDKTKVLYRMANADPGDGSTNTFRNAAITVALNDKITGGGVALKACKLCGDCATGCNYGAKESLDTNLLVQAHRRGAEIYCGGTVLSIRRRADLWEVLATHTDEKLRQREGEPQWIATRRLILAAGALGSTELLLRAQRGFQPSDRNDADAKNGVPAKTLTFSPLLGKRFSANGDLLGFGYAYAEPANAFADEDQSVDAPADPSVSGQRPGRRVGPTITGVIDASWPAATHTPARKFTIEEMAVPGPLRRFAAELVTTADTLHALGETDTARHTRDDADPLAVNPGKLRHTSVFAVMGDDGANGQLHLSDPEPEALIDGAVSVVWPDLPTLPLFDAQLAHLEALARKADLKGRTLPNPLWRLLPKQMEGLIRNQRGPLLTVHPLGGCSMGDDVAAGVVDQHGAVFDADGAAGSTHENLLVLDGAMVPTALSTNPALTIAALALRAAEHWREKWKWTQVEPGYRNSDPAVERRVYANPAPDESGKRPAREATLADVSAAIAARQGRGHATEAQFTERLSGPAVLPVAHGRRRCQVELTLTYKPLRLSRLFTPDDKGRMSAAKLRIPAHPDPQCDPPAQGRLRVIDEADWLRLQRANLTEDERERELEAAALCVHELSGSLTLLRRKESSVLRRIVRALIAWVRNRFLRDAWAWARGRGSFMAGGLGALASHAGEMRLFEYKLKIRDAIKAAPPRMPIKKGQHILGCKRITYARPSNPWRQLQELSLTRFPGLRRWMREPVLTLDARFLASRQTPLFRYVAQVDHMMALVDAGSLVAYVLRLMLSVHLWNARKPDLPRLRQIQRLPPALPGLQEPEIHRIEVDQLDGAPVHAQLTRYFCRSTAPPVVLIHGYSASGTTFAHHSLRPSLAQYLVEAGRDVWVLDLRSSCGMPHATYPWTFERIALSDIPAAVDHVCAVTGQAQVDVIAHCMGAAMLSMAVLSAEAPWTDVASERRDRRKPDLFRAERRALPARIRRAVLSQIGPVMVMSPQNTFRSFVMSFVSNLLGPVPYRFRPEVDDGLVPELLDRLLATLPYPDEELRRENATWPGCSTEFVGTRHRMDALYGRAFKLGNVSDEVLDHIDDFFGEMNLETVGQVAHFGRQLTVTNRAGRNCFVTTDALRKRWKFPTLSLHGDENELADPATLERMAAVLGKAGCSFQPRLLRGRGHQDCLIGKDSIETFGYIVNFLGKPGPVDGY